DVGRSADPFGYETPVSNRTFLVGLVVPFLLILGGACRWESWDYLGPDGASVFRYRGLLLPWQVAPAPPPGAVATTVVVQKWSYYGLNRFDTAGPPATVTSPDGPPAPRTR
ncbi:MAG TPA: hypothetical protein VD866_07435, partial [Urbifossiella sp.]|nr:hypothetical protein [Urbifossiella sp.]